MSHIRDLFFFLLGSAAGISAVFAYFPHINP